jgi:hypothetical protein
MEGVAKIISKVHAGIITSFFEGMPCFMLEVLSSGRPMGTIRLPQYDLIVKDGLSGFFVERAETAEVSADKMSDAFVALWNDIRVGRIDPEAINSCIDSYSVDNQLPRVFEIHRKLVAGRQSAPFFANARPDHS